MSKTPNFWTEHPEAIPRLVELWESKLSASKIAAKLTHEFKKHITRNAVIGKAHRMGCDSRPSPIRGGPVRRKKKRLAGSARPPRPTILNPVPTVVREKVDTLPPIPRPRRGKKNDLGTAGCQYPTDHGQCGTPRTRSVYDLPSPYCVEHYRTCYIIPAMGLTGDVRKRAQAMKVKIQGVGTA